MFPLSFAIPDTGADGRTLAPYRLIDTISLAEMFLIDSNEYLQSQMLLLEAKIVALFNILSDNIARRNNLFPPDTLSPGLL